MLVLKGLLPTPVRPLFIDLTMGLVTFLAQNPDRAQNGDLEIRLN